MKLSAVILLLVMPTLAVAQNYPGMNGVDMQKLQEMQSCMENVDQDKLKALEQGQNQFEAEVKSLCASGKRDEAQKKAVSYAKEMMSNPAIQALSKCGEIAKGMMPEMPYMNLAKETSSQHICDMN
jgi:type II secretory pathway component PulJ